VGSQEAIYLWTLREAPGSRTTRGKSEIWTDRWFLKRWYYGTNMPTPMVGMRKYAKVFDTREAAEEFLIRRFQKYPAAKCLYGLRPSRVKCVFRRKRKHKYEWDFWHPLNSR